MKKIAIATLTLAVAAFAQTANAQTVANGSFEVGTVDANAPGAASIDTTTIPSWRVYNVSGTAGFNVREDYANDGFGSQLIRLDVNNTAAAPVGTYGFDQTNYVPVTAGTTYTIGFYAASLGGDGLLYANVAGFTGPGGDIDATPSNQGTYNNDGDLVAFTISNTATTVATPTQAATDFDGPYSNLQYYSLTYTPLAGTNSIDLDFVPGGGEIIADAVVLDDITVTGPALATPEPTTWAMLLTGMAALVGFTVRRRSQS
jgi:hypothetical protein